MLFSSQKIVTEQKRKLHLLIKTWSVTWWDFFLFLLSGDQLASMGARQPACCSASSPPPASSHNRGILLRQKLKVDTEMSVFLPSSWMWIKPVETSSYTRLPDCEAWVSRHFCVGGWVLAAKRTNHQDCSPTCSPFWNLPSPFALSVIIFLQMVDFPFFPRKLSNIFC